MICKHAFHKIGHMKMRPRGRRETNKEEALSPR